MMHSIAHSEEPYHPLAWDNFSFSIPLDWNLSFYHFDRKYSSLRMEDDAIVRLELEWVRMRSRVDARRIHERYAELTRTLEKVAKRVADLTDLPAGCAAFLYGMEDERLMATSMWLSPDGRFFAFFRVHFVKGERKRATEVMRRLLTSLTLHDSPVVPWRVYDFEFELDRRFALVNTGFQAGSKMMMFEHRMRRLYLWHFSLADVILKGRTPAQYAEAFMAGFRLIRGVLFKADGPERVKVVRRRLRFPLGHYDEIGRACFRYQVGVKHLVDRNTLVLWVYNYRRRTDPGELRGSLYGIPLNAWDAKVML